MISLLADMHILNKYTNFLQTSIVNFFCLSTNRHIDKLEKKLITNH